LFRLLKKKYAMIPSIANSANIVPMMAPVSDVLPPLPEPFDAAVVDEDAPEVVVDDEEPEDELLEANTDCELVCPPHVVSFNPAVV
jgi:hypothetical protein